jgi:Flp pilus assembly protein TadD
VDNPKRTEAETLFFQGVRSMEIGDAALAESYFVKAIEIAPDYAEAHANLGLMLDKRGDMAAAEIHYRRSLELNSAYFETHLNLGALLLKMKRFFEAELSYKLALALKPYSPAGWSNLGMLYACMKREDEAEHCCRKAISIDESHAAARFNLSYLLLRQGRFEEGWHCLEARNWTYGLAKLLTCPRWNGEPLLGKSILIGYEAGHGDMIQFCRYASVLKSMGTSSITLICHPPLKALFSSLKDVDRIISYDEPIPLADCDFWTPPLSIPYFCKTRHDSIPAKIPYLQPPASHIEKWKGFIPKKGLRVGLAWKGSPQFENDADRSLPSLGILLPLWAVTGISYVSLQKGSGEAEAVQPPGGLSLINLGPLLEDFLDTAAVVANLDLVICVDTAVAHLAGALGKPCWVLLPNYKTDWRWLKDREDSPWYPETMRLFRQTASGDWSTAITKVVADLEQLASGTT